MASFRRGSLRGGNFNRQVHLAGEPNRDEKYFHVRIFGILKNKNILTLPRKSIYENGKETNSELSK